MSEQQLLSTPENQSPSRTQRVFRPAVDIVETPSGVSVVAEVPGVDEANLDVTIERNTLTIRGHVPAADIGGMTPTHLEYETGDYERRFTIGEDLDPETVDATLKDGLLTVTLQRKQERGPKKVEIKTA